MVSVDKTDGFNIFLNKDCLTADIVTAKSSEMNVSIPDEDGEYVSVLCRVCRSWEKRMRFLD